MIFKNKSGYRKNKQKRKKLIRRNMKIKYRSKKLNVYHGKLEGIKTAEIKFDSIEESKNFVLPRWFGKVSLMGR